MPLSAYSNDKSSINVVDESTNLDAQPHVSKGNESHVYMENLAIVSLGTPMAPSEIYTDASQPFNRSTLCDMSNSYLLNPFEHNVKRKKNCDDDVFLVIDSSHRQKLESKNLDPETIIALKEMLDPNNALAKSFRYARDHFIEDNLEGVKMRLIRQRNKDGRTYNLPSASELAALVVGYIDGSIGDRDIIIETQSRLLQCIDVHHPFYLALQFPLLFSYGEDGYRNDVMLNLLASSKDGGRKIVSIREAFTFRLQNKEKETLILLSSRKLFPHFMVDAYTMIEAQRLNFLKYNQTLLRADLYKGLNNALSRGEKQASAIGMRIVLPSSFTGGPKYMSENCKDAFAICHWADDKPKSVKDLDKIISAEIPDDVLDPELYDVVKACMMHGPCGRANPKSPCMKGGKNCTKHFPRGFCSRTTIDEEGFPHYRRKDNGRTVKKKGVELDNQYVVPYNAKLLLKYKAHLNVEYTCQTSAIKYLFEYIHKGDCRYVSACEAAWRIFGFPIHYRSPSVQRLSFHLEDKKYVIYRDNDDIEEVLSKVDSKKTMFEAWMEANRKFDFARELIYAEFPTQFVYNEQIHEWTKRNKGFAIGRIAHVLLGIREESYLRILLNIQRGCRSYKAIRTINGTVFPNFKEACYALGLLADDKEYIAAINEAHLWGQTGHFLRQLFASLLYSKSMCRPEHVWDSC
ncbi:hypothetical protein SLEP1_g12438 [Rubroshorea leprosula]|uniref:Helitron helicase-like domain-containing protein n=1 Tax=Rubroshorea leprosula TaxID=152421 RepID=A0AAV5ILQ5_9ROSI|nr:hypothetical protein SLEP1_g12438 [Rubroshorea leprosula]